MLDEKCFEELLDRRLVTGNTTTATLVFDFTEIKVKRYGSSSGSCYINA